MPNGVYGPCTTDVKPHGATSGPRFAHLLTLWLAPSSLHAQIDTWCRGRQTGGLSAPRLQRCGPAVSRLIQSNLPLSQAGAAGCSPSSSRLEAPQTTQLSSAVQTARREGGGALLVKLVSTNLSQIKSNSHPLTARPRCRLRFGGHVVNNTTVLKFHQVEEFLQIESWRGLGPCY